MALVQLQRWWRRCLLKLYEAKAKSLAEQQHMLETKIAIIKAQLVDPNANLPMTSLYDGLEVLHEQPTEDINAWMNEHEKLRAAVFDQLQAIKTNVQYAQPSPAVTPARPSRPIKGLSAPSPKTTPRPTSLPSPAHSAASSSSLRHMGKNGMHPLQDSLEGMEKSFHILLRVMRVKVPSSIIVSHQIQQTIVRLLSEIHERLDETMQIQSSSMLDEPPATPKASWKTMTHTDALLPYTLGSDPWNRLCRDWAQGSETKVASLHRWLDAALHKPTNCLKPIELQCLHPVVLEGFLKLVVPALKAKHGNMVVQTKPLTGTLLRLQFQSSPSTPSSTVYNMRGTMVA
ncbi:hypothetical protein SPRG_10197 [Saprolegnia parasitica CBS 223.65]|uniref:Uncharacterized protein n=1 Tax=Saprolegnia parasitica (strain CBS 223.65) TaxID=695850 RepID=A0A067C1M1_SAPPC|nr:hypothetical protein SPRG_10197 [Saprolegnia parasitica CBS 223.65]KDO24664.1 hypothetical protein SPRG_10197 [Saprolegnia parasitica CBS 223.65]|eukprot:XP_012204545.1 hypothetical protein SPRG_10197 [Saprolegnia parasitica CBS 223.65]